MPTITHANCPVCKSDKINAFMSTKDHSISQEAFDISKCGVCDFVFTQNIPDQNSIGKYYQSDDYISHSDTKEGLINKIYHFSRNYMLGQKRKVLQKYVGNSKKLLDIGSGTGYFLDHMTQNGWDGQGVEPDENARALSIKNFKVKVDPLDLLMEMDEGQFDAITMWHVLEHVHDLEGYVRKIRKLLKSDGTLVVAVPNYTSFDGSFYKEYWAGYDLPRHLWHFSPKTIELLFNKNGFSLEKKYRMPLDSFYVALLSEKYKKHSLALLRGAVIGGISYLNSLFNRNKCSSVIYVLKPS